MSVAIASLFTSAYFGYRGFSYIAVVVFAVIAAGSFLWATREMIGQAQRNAAYADSTPRLYTAFVTVLLFIALAVVSVAINSAIYFFMRWVS